LTIIHGILTLTSIMFTMYMARLVVRLVFMASELGTSEVSEASSERKLGKFDRTSFGKTSKLILLILVAVLGLIGCTNSGGKITMDDFKKVESDITLDCGITVLELEEKLNRFIYKVYNPQREEDILEGIQELEDIMEESEYKWLVSEASEFRGDIKTSIDNIIIKYSKGKNSTDEMARALAGLTLKVGEREQDIIIEFVFNREGLIFKHYIWKGNIK